MTSVTDMSSCRRQLGSNGERGRDQGEIRDSGCREKSVSKNKSEGQGDGGGELKPAEIKGREDCSSTEYISQAGLKVSF